MRTIYALQASDGRGYVLLTNATLKEAEVEALKLANATGQYCDIRSINYRRNGPQSRVFPEQQQSELDSSNQTQKL